MPHATKAVSMEKPDGADSPDNRTVLQQHVDFWDFDHDGECSAAACVHLARVYSSVGCSCLVAQTLRGVLLPGASHTCMRNIERRLLRSLHGLHATVLSGPMQARSTPGTPTQASTRSASTRS